MQQRATKEAATTTIIITIIITTRIIIIIIITRRTTETAKAATTRIKIIKIMVTNVSLPRMQCQEVLMVTMVLIIMMQAVIIEPLRLQQRVTMMEKNKVP